MGILKTVADELLDFGFKQLTKYINRKIEEGQQEKAFEALRRFDNDIIDRSMQRLLTQDTINPTNPTPLPPLPLSPIMPNNPGEQQRAYCRNFPLILERSGIPAALAMPGGNLKQYSIPMETSMSRSRGVGGDCI